MNISSSAPFLKQLIESTNYFKYESRFNDDPSRNRFNGDLSRNNLYKVKDEAYVIDLDDKVSIGKHCEEKEHVFIKL